MKKIFLILFSILSFSLYAQKTDENISSSFSTESSDSSSLPQLIIHNGGFFDVYSFKLLDGTKLSDKNLNEILRSVPENKSLLKKKAACMGFGYAFIAGFLASVTVNIYAANKGWANMTYYSAVAGTGCFAYAVLTGMSAHSYRSAAVDNYNLSVMGIQIK